MTDVSKVLQFDGQDDAVELAAAHLVGLGPGDFTVEAWVRIDAWGDSYQPILGTDTAATNVGLHLAIKDQRPYLGFYDNDLAGRTVLALGVWYHLAWRFTAGRGEQAILVNGVVDASATGKMPFAGGAETVRIGRYAVDQHFRGQLAELRIWRSARTAEEIFAGMHRRLRGDEAHLVACWPLDDGTGTEAANRRVALPGEDHGAAPVTLVRTLPDDGSPTPPPRLRLNGTGHVDMPRHEDLELTQYTFETWIRPDALPGTEGSALAGRRRTSVMSFDGTGDYFAVRDLHYQAAIDGVTVEAWVKTTKTSQGIIASWDRSEYWRFAVCNDAGLTQGGVFLATAHRDQNTVDDMVGSTVVNDGSWHHVAATYDRASGAKKIYVDGALDAEKTIYGDLPFGTGLTRYGFIGTGSEAGAFDGTKSPADYFQGQMAELRIWDHARSETEIAQDMNRRLLGNESGLVGYWPLDILTAGETPDESVNSYAGVSRGDVTLSTDDPPPLDDVDLDLLAITADGAIRHRCLTDAGVTGPGDTAAGSIAPGRWSHVAVSCDGTTARTLIDGAVVSEAAVSGLRPAVDPLRLGEGYQGALAAARLWSIARPAAEIAANKGRLLAGTETGLVADWPLDETSGTAILNRVSGGPTGTLVGGARADLPAAPFPGQQALELDGTGARITVPHAPEIHFARSSDSFTVELWMRPEAGDAESVVLEKWTGIGSYPYALRYRPAGGEIVFARSTGAATSTAELLISTADLADGEFHHLAAVKDAATLRLYVDGALAGEMADPITSTIRGTSALHVGSRGGTGHFFRGAITELRLWRRARTPTEIAAGRWQRLTGGEADLAGYWPLVAVADGQVADGLLRPAGTLAGPTWIDGVDLPLRAADAAVETAPAAGFDGLESVVRVAADPALMPAATITVEAWVRPEAAGGQAYEGPVVSCGDAVSGWALRATDAECDFLLTLDHCQYQVCWPSTAGAGRWLHLAGVYDGQAIQLYVHGVPVAAARQVITGAITPYAGELLIGGHPYWSWQRFRGQIAEVRVWSVARTAAQIHQHLFRRLTGSELGLVGYWPLADGEGTVATSGGGTAGDGAAESVHWTAADLPPRVAPALTPAADSPDRLALLESRLAEIDAQIAAVESTNQLLDLQRNELLRQATEMQESLDDRRAALRAPLEEEIAVLNQQITGAGSRQAELEAAGVDAFIDDLIADSHKKIESSRAELAKKEGSHALKRVNVQLKFVAGANGEGAIFPSLATAVDPARITTLDLDFEPVGTTAPAATPKRAVPSVIGMTRALAERRLGSAGLTAEFQYQAVRAVAGRPSPIGRVMSQLPRAGSQVLPGSNVRLFLGKAS